MSLLGIRLRQRRRQLGLRQRDLAGESGASFISKVESGAAQPSLKSLLEWSTVLRTTAGSLLGDELLLEAAKHCILHTDKCLSYLEQLEESELTRFLKELTQSANSVSTPVPNPPPDPELEYLAAQVLLHKRQTQEAEGLLLGTLAQAKSAPWRIFHLSLLCAVYAQEGDSTRLNEVRAQLKEALSRLTPDELVHTLPEPHLLSSADLYLLRLSTLLNALDKLQL